MHSRFTGYGYQDRHGCGHHFRYGKPIRVNAFSMIAVVIILDAVSIRHRRSQKSALHKLELVFLHCAIRIERAFKVPIGPTPIRTSLAQHLDAWHTKQDKYNVKINNSFSRWPCR